MLHINLSLKGGLPKTKAGAEVPAFIVFQCHVEFFELPEQRGPYHQICDFIFDFDTAILGITRLGFVAAAVFAGHCFVHYTIKKQIHRLSELLFEKFKKQLL